MTRKEMLELLHRIPNPIITYVCQNDMGYDYRLLTKDKGIFSAGAFWPIRGPLKITHVQYTALMHAMLDYWEDSDEDHLGHLIRDCDLSSEMKDFLNHLLFSIGSDFFKATVKKTPWPFGEEFFIFKDYNDDRISDVFLTLEDARNFFVEVYASNEEGDWESMTDVELEEWCEDLERWREEGASEFPAIL